MGDYPSGDHHQLRGAGAGTLQQALSWQGCFPGEIAVAPAALLLDAAAQGKHGITCRHPVP